MREKMSATRSIGITAKPLSSLQLKYIPTHNKNMHNNSWQNEANCHFCQTIQFHHYPLNPNAKEFIPRRPAGIENTAPSWSGAFVPDSWRHMAASNGWIPYNKPVPGPAQRPAPCLPGGPTRLAGPSRALTVTRPARTDAGQSTTQGAAVINGVSRDGTSAKVGSEAASRCTGAGPKAAAAAAGSTAGPADSPSSGPERRAADTPPQRGAEEVDQKQSAVVVQKGTERPTPQSAQCDSCMVPLSSAVETELSHKINSVRVSPDSDDVPCSLTSPDSVHNTRDISKRTRSPSQCSDSAQPRRANSRDSRANNPAACASNDNACAQSATSPAAAPVVPCQPSSSTSDLDTSSECDAPAAAGRWRPLSSSVSISSESSDDSSDESSDNDSTLGDEEWEASAATFLPSSSVDSADDFILFADEDECCPTETRRSPTAAPTVPQTPAFGPCLDQVDSGLSAETDPSESDAEDLTDDELSEDECDSCRIAAFGTCVTHQRIAEANQQMSRWCCTPPLQPRTCKVRFLSGDRLATVHAAPDYDRGIASDLLDQQRQRDQLCRWRQDVDRQVAPVLAAVLTPEHRRRVLSERPELLRS